MPVKQCKATGTAVQAECSTIRWTKSGRCFLNLIHHGPLIETSSALTSGRSLRLPSFSTVAQSGVEILRQFSNPNSRNDERTCLRSGRTLRPFSPHSSVLTIKTAFFTMSSSSPINSVSNSYIFNYCFFSHVRSSRKPVHSKSSTCT